MIDRDAAPALRALAQRYPVVSLTGPRQSGKTTLCRAVFPAHPYVTLEPLDVRAFAREDPRGFLAQHQAGAIIDEVQRVPELLSYLQADVDERPKPGRFILTGSQELAVGATVAQSLAGRVGRLELHPCSWGELQRFANAPADILEVLWTGGYPRILDRSIPPSQWLADYVATYVQRDVRQLLNVVDLEAFTNFVRLCAGSTATPVHLTRLGADAGVSHPTVRAWLSVLEASFLIRRLPAWHPHPRKRVVRAAKLHVVDSGLCCYLLGIREPEQLRAHPLRGAIFESWVAMDVMKQGAHRGAPHTLSHYREEGGLEVDLVLGDLPSPLLVEMKSGATVASDFIDGVRRVAERLAGRDANTRSATRVVYGGTMPQTRGATDIVPWNHVDRVSWG
ncbi:MAG: ATP-binding protein [Gemmatimonadaceae bacterium]|nr:ATP-binding protein [Gemmatimonadaceae bacterium]